MRDLVLQFIDEADDAHELNGTGDYFRNIFTIEGIPEWQFSSIIKALHTELILDIQRETNKIRCAKLRIALSVFEDEFADQLISREIDSLRS